MWLLPTLTMSAIGALCLWGLYRALEITWPTQYISLTNTFALRVSQSWWRLIAFRSVPVFIAALAVGVTTTRIGGNAALSIGVMIFIHLLHTNAFALWKSFRTGTARLEVNYSAYHLSVIGIVALTGLIASVAGPALRSYVPQPETLIENLWIALFVAVASGVAISVIGKRPEGSLQYDGTYFIWRARRDVGIDLSDFAYIESLRTNVDPGVLRAIMFAEALQRPRWIRNLERLTGLFHPEGTYGVTQERSKKPINDLEAISLTAERLAGRWPLRMQNGFLNPDMDLLWLLAADHNDDLAFIAGVRDIYFAHRSGAKILLPADLPFELFEVRRYGTHAGLRINVYGCGHVSVHFNHPESGQIVRSHIVRPAGVRDDELWAGELALPFGVYDISFHYEYLGLTLQRDVVLSSVTS